MLVAGSNNWLELGEETLGGEGKCNKMGKDETARVEDVEEGEISDSASVEEISKDDFNKQEEEDVVVVKESKPKDARVWTMTDLYRYQIKRGYVSGLYNLAWAQAVQNKPLNEIFVEVEHNTDDNNSKRSSPSSSVASSVNSSNKVVIDVSADEMDGEKEEGELEEGEIDLDSNGVEMNVDGSEELEKKVKSIEQDLQSVTVGEAEKSFDAVCSKLHGTFESLREVTKQNNIPTKDALVQLLLSAVRTLNMVFASMKHDLKEHNKDVFSRILSIVNIHDPPFLNKDQIKEMEAIIASLESSKVSLSAKDGEKDKEAHVYDGVNNNNKDTLARSAGSESAMVNMLSPGADYFSHNKPNTFLEVPKPGINFKGKVGLLPLLDLHKDHDADSLPSPTHETAPPVPVHNPMIVRDGFTRSGVSAPKLVSSAEESKMHPYETDALQAVSSYQQKFGCNSFFITNRLPSPTPSEESGDEDGDTAGEISSSLNVGNIRTLNLPNLGQQIAFPSPPQFESSNLLGSITVRTTAPPSSVSASTVKSTAKSRDPRLRFLNSDANTLDQNQRSLPSVNNMPKVDPVGAMLGSRKQKPVEYPIVDGPLKRQKNAFGNPGIVRDVKNMTGSGGWLEDRDAVGPQSINRNKFAENSESDPRRLVNGLNHPCTAYRNEQVPITGTSTATGGELAPVMGHSMPSLPDLLKDIAVNPTMLINILKLGRQQRLASEAQQKLADLAKTTTNTSMPNSILGAVPAVKNTSQSSAVLVRPSGTVQAPSQTATTTSQDESGKIRMKPRDPRRVLHNNSLQRAGSMSSEQSKSNAIPTSTTKGTSDNHNVQKQEGQAEMMTMPSQSVPPDISLPFTKSLMNIADVVSVSQTSTTSSVGSQNSASQQMQNKSVKVEAKPAILSSDHQAATVSFFEVGARSQSTWGDVEHLFEGYDDHQKAAIQKERARRIEEQKKMFAARKLCLVLDLDHTLLNSAKFVEVDPVHEEILRKKEEQDREKPYRHLFRFPHMGMWTKLRPGIWNFLEKASKLYELHLYTMGNKLYATEMAKVLDPKGVLFNGRVISKGDDGDYFDGDERVPKSKDLEGVLGMESSVVIIDDSVRVWPHNKLNLIVVERYIYFPCSRRQFGLPGPSLLEIDHDERPEDGTLASSLAVIERVHQNFFNHQSLDEADVRNILASEQRKILAGCRIVFSRVFPVGEANPHLHPLWQTAEQFGAVCTNQMDERVTHVVANSLGTDKVNWALSNGKSVVYPGWVEASALLYRRANEQDFAIKP